MRDKGLLPCSIVSNIPVSSNSRTETFGVSYCGASPYAGAPMLDCVSKRRMTMKKINMLVASIVAIVVMIIVGLTAEASTGKQEPSKVACTCNPACSSGWNCCATANGYCGCFINSCR